MNIHEFIRANHLSAHVLHARRNPNLPDMPRNWRVEIRKWREFLPTLTMVVPFSQGSAHKEPPTLEEVLDCMASDAIEAIPRFEDWADEYGQDPDSRKALTMFEACQKQSAELRALLGHAAFRELLDIERL